MNYTICEAMLWRVMTPAMFRWLAAQKPDWEIKPLKRSAKRIYRQMAARTPEIGSLSKNSLRLCLSAGMVWLSVYEAAEGRMDEACFAGLVQASMEAPLVQASFKSKAKTAFTRKAQQKRADNAAKGNAASESPFNWSTEVRLGRDADEYTILYRRCGLCALGRQEGLAHLVPAMCLLDIRAVEWMGGVLYRTQTLADGGDCCDFYICRKGSRWDGPGEAESSGKEARN